MILEVCYLLKTLLYVFFVPTFQKGDFIVSTFETFLEIVNNSFLFADRKFETHLKVLLVSFKIFGLFFEMFNLRGQGFQSLNFGLEDLVLLHQDLMTYLQFLVF